MASFQINQVIEVTTIWIICINNWMAQHGHWSIAPAKESVWRLCSNLEIQGTMNKPMQPFLLIWLHNIDTYIKCLLSRYGLCPQPLPSRTWWCVFRWGIRTWYRSRNVNDCQWQWFSSRTGPWTFFGSSRSRIGPTPGGGSWPSEKTGLHLLPYSLDTSERGGFGSP